MNNDPFFSIERLLNFGMEVGVAQQMVRSMNQALQGTMIPGPHNAIPAAPSHVYYVVVDGKAAGPFTSVDISRLINEGRVNKETHVWRPGMAAWEKAANVPDVLRLVALAPPPPPFPGGATA
jgi:hypothetical protein